MGFVGAVERGVVALEALFGTEFSASQIALAVGAGAIEHRLQVLAEHFFAKVRVHRKAAWGA